MQGIKHTYPLHDSWQLWGLSKIKRTFRRKRLSSLASSGQRGADYWPACLFGFICFPLHCSLPLDYFLRELFPLLNEEIRLIFDNGINISKLQGKVASENVRYPIRQWRGICGATLMDLKWSPCFIMVTKDPLSSGEDITVTHESLG